MFAAFDGPILIIITCNTDSAMLLTYIAQQLQGKIFKCAGYIPHRAKISSNIQDVKEIFDLSRKPAFPNQFLFMKSEGANFA